MNPEQWTRAGEAEWHLPPSGRMRVPVVVYGTEQLLRDMDDKVAEQAANVAALPGIVRASFAMPDAHWGYGFPIGGVAAFDPGAGGVVSAGGVGFDISCGVRTLHTGLTAGDLGPVKERLADALAAAIPAGMGRRGRVRLDSRAIDMMLEGGAAWAVAQGYGAADDLDRIEERGRTTGAQPDAVSPRAKERLRDSLGTLGSGNHYLEVQRVERVFDDAIAARFGLRPGDIVVSIHSGSRGLGHQIATDFLKRMTAEARSHGIDLPDRDLACAPITSPLGQEYLGAMRAGINCALANRQVITHFARQAFATCAPAATLRLLYDVSHNTCKVETHNVEGQPKAVYVHRKGATRAFGPAHPDLPSEFQETGQPVLIGGSMGTASYVLAGVDSEGEAAFASSCHGAGRSMSRSAALKRWRGGEVVSALAERGILIRAASRRGVAEEAPGAYKDVAEVVDGAERAGLSKIVARLAPEICVKG